VIRASLRLIPLLCVSATLIVSGCASAPKPGSPPVLSDYEGKKVALIDIDGEASGRAVVEVALINELIKRGTFILVPKNEVDQARNAPDVDPTDWRAIAERAGSDIALRARIARFDAETKEGYSAEEVYDSQLAKERGKKEGKTNRLFKVKSMKGVVEVELEFADARSKTDASFRKGTAAHEETVSADAKSGSIHLPPKLRFLEGLARQAFRKFFEQYE